MHFSSESDSNDLDKSSAQREDHEDARSQTFSGILIEFKADDEYANGPIRANSESISNEINARDLVGQRTSRLINLPPK
jgi:hypothetical protein